MSKALQLLALRILVVMMTFRHTVVEVYFCNKRGVRGPRPMGSLPTPKGWGAHAGSLREFPPPISL